MLLSSSSSMRMSAKKSARSCNLIPSDKLIEIIGRGCSRSPHVCKAISFFVGNNSGGLMHVAPP